MNVGGTERATAKWGERRMGSRVLASFKGSSYELLHAVYNEMRSLIAAHYNYSLSLSFVCP